MIAADGPGITVPPGFVAQRIATVGGARELSVAPNGDLFVGTNGTNVDVIPNAQGEPGAPRVFATINDAPVAGVTVAAGAVYIGGQFGVYRVAYANGDRRANGDPKKIAAVRTSGTSSDHHTVTLAVTHGKLYASVGSSCNACDPELDATRATIQEMNLDGSEMHARARHIRNAIALAVEPVSGDLWAGVAQRDDLPHGHPFEIFDDVSMRAGTPDYGWLTCYEDRKPIGSADCSDVVVPLAAFPAYNTPIGATFYGAGEHARYAFPAEYRGGVFVALHGSWHTPLVPPRVAFVPFRDGKPAHVVNWSNGSAQWTEFVSGCQNATQERACRPTGVAVGTDGSLFVSEDQGGAIWRIRPIR